MTWSNLLTWEERRGKTWFWQISGQLRTDTFIRIRQADNDRILWEGQLFNMPPTYNMQQMMDTRSMGMEDGFLCVRLIVDEDFIRAQYKTLPSEYAERACASC